VKRRYRILLVGSSGGHLAQLLALQEWWSKHDRVWVTFSTPDAIDALSDERVEWCYFPTTRSTRALLKNARLAWTVLRNERPDVVISTGAAVAVPFFALARLRGIPRVYIEVVDRVASTTLSGRLCRPIATAFLVQWEAQKQLYPGSTVVGRLL
jgi:UDP-N-acetylglucosamine:LPS N-acetylglucosamine transferase